MDTINTLPGGVDVNDDGDNAARFTDNPLHLVDDDDGLVEQDMVNLYVTDDLLHHGYGDIGDDEDDGDDSLIHQDIVKLYLTNSLLHHNDGDDDGMIGEAMTKPYLVGNILHHGGDECLIEQDMINSCLANELIQNNDGDAEDDGEDESLIEEDMTKSYLTDDLLYLVFSFLDQNSLCFSAMVCRQWHRASLHEDFWQSLSFVGEHVTEEKVGWLCLKYPKAIGLSLKEVPCVEEVAREAMYSLKGLKRLELLKGNLTDSFFNALADGCCALEELTVNNILLGHGGAQEILICHENLHQLEVIECKVMRITIRCPLLITLSLKRTNMSYVTVQCPILHTLDMSSCPKLSDANIRSAISGCSLLSDFDVSHNSCVTDAIVQGIASICRNLHMLDVSQCPNVTAECVPFPILRGMRLQSCTNICHTSSFILPMYESIRSDVCAFLTSATLDLQLLHNITLANFHKYIDSILRYPLRMNINLSTSSMLNIDLSPLAFQRLLFHMQPSYSTMSLQNPFLHRIKLPRCDFSENSISRLCIKATPSYGLTSLTSAKNQDLRLVISNYFPDGAPCMRFPSDFSGGPIMFYKPLKKLKMEGFVSWFLRIEPNDHSKCRNHDQKRKQLGLRFWPLKEQSKVKIKEQTFCFQIHGHEKHGLILAVNSKTKYFGDTLESYNYLRTFYRSDNRQGRDPGIASLNVPNRLKSRIREELAMVYHKVIQIWQQGLQLLDYNTAFDSLYRVHGQVMLEGILTWSYPVAQNENVSIYEDYQAKQLSRKLLIYREIKEQDYLHEESVLLVGYKFKHLCLEASRSSYSCIRNFNGCVKDGGKKLLVSELAFALVISQYSMWTCFPDILEFGYRDIKGGFSVHSPILVNSTGDLPVTYLNLRILEELDIVYPLLVQFWFQVVLHGENNYLTKSLNIKAYVYQYLKCGIFSKDIVDLPSMFTFDALIFSWAQTNVLEESMDSIQSISVAVMSKQILDLLLLEIIFNLSTRCLLYAQAPYTLPAIEFAMVGRWLAFGHCAQNCLQEERFSGDAKICTVIWKLSNELNLNNMLD